MRKFSILLLAVTVVFAFTFAGCDFVTDMIGGGGGDQPPAPAPPAPTPAPAPAPTPAPAPAPVPNTGGMGGSYTESGYLNGPGDSYNFTVDAGTQSQVDVIFDYPYGSVDFWVKVVGEDGYTVLGDFDLDNGEIIQLLGGGTFYLTIYSRMGAGYWSGTYELTGSGGGAMGPSTGMSSCNVSGNSAWGYLNGPGDYCDWSIYAQSDYIEVVFDYPVGSVDFWVEVVGEDGYTVLGDFDLDNGEIIQLMGGGMFYLTVYSNYGAGDWSAYW